ncbi:Superfamily II DNA and RNA helicase [Thermoplasmatales archaeon BRNA1]|nr:Superfamily II DNA and RNA helicase [Thermoplasmatales archaeon BRNA1]
MRAVRSAGWTEPTPVQTAAIPVGLNGEDLFAQAQTGTGKTGTYGSIILSRTEAGSAGPTSLILVPTRELATQVAEELDRLSKYSRHTSLPIYGGVSIENQVKELKKGADVIVATPGRLKDLIERKSVNLSEISIVVLDEADRMLDMGFAPSVNMILNRLPKKRQTMMFSATMPDDVRKMAVKYMINYREILVSKDEPTLDLTAQYFIMTNRDSKRDELIHIIEDGYPKMMVFCRTKRKVDFLTRKMKRDKYSVEGIHGDVGQSKRERIIQEFKDGDLKVLIASDVASRGLDIDGVDVVVNFDIPVDPETYIHRIGRTGRAGNTGRAITFVTEDDIKQLNAIEKAVGRRIVELPFTSDKYEYVPVEEPKKRAKEIKQRNAAKKVAAETAAKAPEKAARLRKTVEAAEEGGRKKTARTLSGALDRPVKGKAKKAQREQPREEPKAPVRVKEPEVKKVVKEPPREEPKPEPVQETGGRFVYTPQGVPKNPRPLHAYVQIDRAPAPEKDMTMDRLELSIGSNDGVTVDNLAKFIVRVAGIAPKDIGNIHVYADKSRVQVVRWRSQEVVDEVFGQTFNDKRRVLITNLSDKRL